MEVSSPAYVSSETVGKGRGRGRGSTHWSAGTAVGRGRGSTHGSAAPVPGFGRGRSKVNWSGDAARQLSESPSAGPPSSSISSSTDAWQQTAARIFGESLSVDQPIASSSSLISLRWEPPERDCYMLLANMLQGTSTTSASFR